MNRIEKDKADVFAIITPLLTPVKSKSNRRDKAYICPICGSKSLFINSEKQKFYCHVCGRGGGRISFWAFFRGLPPDDTKRIAKDLAEYTGEISDALRYTPIKERKMEIYDASVSVRDRAYRAFLSKLSLKDEHYRDLKRRGYSRKSIEARGFKSTPSPEKMDRVVADLEEHGIVFKGVSGFHVTPTGKIKGMVCPSGYFLPIKDKEGNILGLHIRSDKKEPKYLTFSSTSKPGGAQWKSPVHTLLGENNDIVIITEGILKAEIIHSALGVTTIGVLGINATKSLVSTLEGLDLPEHAEKHVVLDMDFTCNAAVHKAAWTITRLIDSIPGTTTTFTMGSEKLWKGWEKLYIEKGIKGFDDFLLHISNRGLLEKFKEKYILPKS
jgi:hypothetical protein